MDSFEHMLSSFDLIKMKAKVQENKQKCQNRRNGKQRNVILIDSSKYAALAVYFCSLSFSPLAVVGGRSTFIIQKVISPDACATVRVRVRTVVDTWGT